MRFIDYLKDKIFSIIIFILIILVLIYVLIVFNLKKELIILILSLYIFQFLIITFYEYFRKKNFYDEILYKVKDLNKKYLILELLEKPKFYEGILFYEILYDINKSMIEKIKEYSENILDFKEYIEIWIHEVKLPLSALNLKLYNNKNFDKTILSEIKRINDNVDQVLYYVRSENSEKDYVVKETNLKEIVSEVILKNKDILLLKNINLIVEDLNYIIITDSKWLEFIINQIFINSIKYLDKENSIIKISTKILENEIKFKIYDNGIGILEKDIKKVFNKSFTGENGRKISNSTGMGLYIVKKMCDKLGHKISVNSKINEYTEIEITFIKNNYFDVVR